MMSAYDTYGETQIKYGDQSCETYKIGDTVLIPDGIYIGYPGAIVILNNKFIAEFPSINYV